MDHMRRRNVAIDRTEMIVLDEADEMLDMGFYQDVRWILDRVPRTKQMSMFSATIPVRSWISAGCTSWTLWSW